MNVWPEPVERVATFLRDAKAEARLEEFLEGTPTAEDAAKAVGCDLSQIVKSLVFDCDGRAVVVMVPGDRRADRRKIAAALGCASVKVAGPTEVARATGFEAGGVAPFPLTAVDAVLIEPALLGYETVWIGAGSSRHMASLSPSDLVRLSHAKPVDVVSERHN
jgi:prolyl-tRNA editing enzyme YbaK/EbsC (Cys-tRNA(Pro) deacylase)